MQQIASSVTLLIYVNLAFHKVCKALHINENNIGLHFHTKRDYWTANLGKWYVAS